MVPERKPRLELTWIGKEERRAPLEPRILLEDASRSHAVPSPDGLSDNRLIFGDNLLALKALEAEFDGEVKCIYIDPPFNTGAAFEHYDDGVEHSLWLSLMRQRFEILHRLLSRDGVLVVHLDDIESAYAKVLLDEIFGRGNYLNTVTTTTNAPSGFKATSSTIFSTANHLLFYARDKATNPLRRVYLPKAYDTAYSKYLIDPGAPIAEWRWTGIAEKCAQANGLADVRAARKSLNGGFESLIADFAVANARHVFRTAAIGGGAAIKRRATIEKSRTMRDVVLQHPNEDVDGFLILNGEQIIFYDDRLVELDGARVPGEIITDVWTDIGWTGIAREGGVEFKNGKKPEALIRRVLEMTTSPGDLVLDSFAGSGTTGAVAHKMGRRWIMVELGEHCHTHIIPRLRRVIDGDDSGGVTAATNWQGGGGYRYYSLAPSLLQIDANGREIVNRKFDAAMLAAAVCKIEGYTHAPSETVYWQHGRSTETDFIYVVAETLTQRHLAALSEDVGPDRSLTVVCRAWRGKADAFPNLTLKRIPKHLRARCEWNVDDYSLNVDAVLAPPHRRRRRPRLEADLFADAAP